MDRIVTLARLEAQGRDVRIDVAGDGVRLITRRVDASRALALVLGAVVKVSSGATIAVTAADSKIPRITVSGGRLDPDRDGISPDTTLTAAALRLQLARVAAARVGGTVDVDASGSVHLMLPRLAES
jgi:hypothetical protein